MKIFVCEFITGGGMQEGILPLALAREGELMLSALLDDLHDCNEHELLYTYDNRLPELGEKSNAIPAGDSVWETWRKLMLQSEATWIIAPETDLILYRLVQLAHECDCRVIGCTGDFIKIASSKLKSTQWLLENNIPAANIYNDPDMLYDNETGWIVKPDDGVGGEGLVHLSNIEYLKEYFLQHHDNKLVIQPFIDGISASLSMLCLKGLTVLLGCNQQCFAFDNNGAGKLESVVVNGLTDYRQEFLDLARKINGLLKKEIAYIGIDLLMTNEGPLVIDINPRLTTSYAGLRKSTSMNPAKLLLSFINTGRIEKINEIQYSPVRIDL